MVVEPYFDLPENLHLGLIDLIELDRQAFLLTTIRGLTFREAAEILDTDHTSVHRHAERARVQIKEAIA